MEGFSREGKVVGVLLDLSLRHDEQGERLVDGVKKALLDMVMKTFEDDLDILYLYHPEVVDPTWKRGEQTFHIGSYDTDGWRFNLNLAIQQTLYAVGAQDHESRRYLMLITDRIEDARPLELAVHLNKKDMLDIHFILVGLGRSYQKAVFESLPADAPVTRIHIDHPSELVPELLKEKDGTQDFCCQTGSCAQ